MPNSVIVKTVLAPRRRAAAILAVVLPCIGIASMAVAHHGYSRVTAHIGRQTYRLQVANTLGAREHGLSNRSSLPADQGMLFSFPDQSIRCFWMKDMHFPLDIIWLDAEKRVLYTKPYAMPASYPHTYCPSEPAQYVIELNAGEAARSGVQKSQTLTF